MVAERPPGWPFKHPAAEAWEHEGVPCAICPSPMGRGWNGYVRLQPGEPFPEVGPPGVMSHGNRWVGFDTAHAWDRWPGEQDDFMDLMNEIHDSTGGKTITWDLEMLRLVVNVMAHAVAEGRRG